MVRNDERRRRLTDAGIGVLAREGARGLTHRAVDAEAQVPAGTTSNYFRSRSALVAGLTRRVYERLVPDPVVLAALAERPVGVELSTAYVQDIVDRLLSRREVTLALFELRLEAARRPELAEGVSRSQREAYAADVAFNRTRGLAGGPVEIALLHYAVDGLVLDRLTAPVAPELPVEVAVEQLVRRLLGGEG